ncbi:SAM-dependent methyltransferase [Planctomycetales bacterium]|nr:SAM-dependent methyltransferase [Planctomycetales bacterium]
MNSSDKQIPYTLLDFGGGRKLERFGNFLFDRPSPSADGTEKKNASLWKNTDFRFISENKKNNSERGQWLPDTPKHFTLSFNLFSLELQGTPFGHLGVFPEQIPNWQRIRHLIKNTVKPASARPLRVLNLFAYTGGSSLAAADSNTEVVHIDSSESIVKRAKCNAELNGITSGIRFIAEDARRFVKREIKRNNRYDAVILDPPSYGHGTKSEVWQLEKHLPELLDGIAVLLNENPVFLLLTAHTPSYGSGVLADMLSSAGLCRMFSKAETFQTDILSEQGLPLFCGDGVLLS